MVRERHRLLEVLLDIQRSISHRKPLSDVLAAITAGASGLLGGCPVALVLDDPLDPERPIVAATTAGGERSESELAVVATAAARSASAPSVDTALAASVHINGARAGALVAMAPTGLDDAQLGMLDAFAEHASLALTDARTVEAMQEAFHDPLTGLPNRALFLDRLQHALDVAARRGTELSRALRRPRPLQGRQRQHRPRRRRHAAARGGRRAWPVHARGRHRGALRRRRVRRPARGRRARRAARGRRRPDHRRACAGPSTSRARRSSSAPRVGIAHAHDASLGPDELLRNADVAMYRAKKAGGNRAAVYETAMRDRAAGAHRARGRPAPRARARRAEARTTSRWSSSHRAAARRRRGARALAPPEPRADPAG